MTPTISPFHRSGTRRRGLRHVAEIRARLAESTSGTEADADVVAFPTRAPTRQRAS